MMEQDGVITEVVPRGRRNPLHFGLAKRLRAAREAADLGIVQLSQAASLSKSASGDIEVRGHVPLLDKVERLAKALKISPCWLAYGIEAPAIEGDVLACQAIGNRLQQVRGTQGLSQNALGKLAGVSHTALGNIEDKGHMPSVATAEKIAKALEVDVCWLSYGQGQAPVSPPTKTEVKSEDAGASGKGRRPRAPRKAG